MLHLEGIENGERHTENAPHIIEFKNVGFTYPNTNVKVLENANITIKQGEHLPVVGLNVAGKTAIYISHRLSSCKFCDRIAVFSEGRIKEYGTHDELDVQSGGIYAEMFAAQAQYYKE